VRDAPGFSFNQEHSTVERKPLDLDLELHPEIHQSSPQRSRSQTMIFFRAQTRETGATRC
jgi:hypothetical protein